jgi:Holliday junction resolvasome RuvABC endonuclease subunit
MKVKWPIVAVDAGFRFLGVSVWSTIEEQFTETYVLSTKRNKNKSVSEDNRLLIEFLADNLAIIIRRAKSKLVVAELPTGASRNARAISAMSMAFSVVVLTCRFLGVPLVVIKPSQVKKMVDPNAGRKKPSKERIVAYAKKYFGDSLLPKTAKAAHVADSMVALKCYLDGK